MKKVTVAICEVNDAYRERLTEYFIRKKAGQIQVSGFSTKKSYLQNKNKKFDIVLWSRGFEGIEQQENKSELYIYMSTAPQMEEAVKPVIFKYQSADEIMRSMFEYYLQLKKPDTYVSRKNKEIIGIYSPTRSRMQTPFALTLAQMLAGEKKILYVNFSEWAGFGNWLKEEYHRDLADLLYLISGYGNQLQGTLECVLHSINRIDYIPPISDGQLLYKIREEDYLALLHLLTEKTDYEVIFLDFGVMVPGFFSLLEQCTSIYSVIDQGELAKSQCRQFEISLMKAEMTHLAEKLEYVSFSPADVLRAEQEPVLQQWLCGVLGDKARTMRYRQHGAN